MTIVPDLRARIVEEASKGLDLKWWHSEGEGPCGDNCCLAGKVVNAHPDGEVLLAAVKPHWVGGNYKHPVAIAAVQILEAHGIPVPNFYDWETGCEERADKWLAGLEVPHAA